MPISRSIDIDSEFDFKIVKFIYENKKYLENFNLSNKLMFQFSGNGQIGSEVVKFLKDCEAKIIILDNEN